MSESLAPVQSPPPTPRVPTTPAPEPRQRLAEMVHALAHRRDSRLLSAFLKLRTAVR